MEERIENVAQGHRGDGTEAEIPRVSSGLHSEDSVIDIESVLPTESPLPSGAERAGQNGGQEVAEAGVYEPVNAVITPEGVQELPPWLIGPDGKPLPINERTLRLIRGKTFTVRHIALTCGHKMDLQNQPKTGCETCWWEWLNNHSTLVQTAHEFYQQFGKERLVAMRGAKFVKYFLMFMSTVAHMIEEQKAQEAANGNDPKQGGANGGIEGNQRERIPVEAADSGRESQTGEISNNPA
jgi:hypothetical protein